MEKIICGFYDGETQPAAPIDLLRMGREPPRPASGPWWLQPPVVPQWADDLHGKDITHLQQCPHVDIYAGRDPDATSHLQTCTL